MRSRLQQDITMSYIACMKIVSVGAINDFLLCVKMNMSKAFCSTTDASLVVGPLRTSRY